MRRHKQTKRDVMSTRSARDGSAARSFAAVAAKALSATAGTYMAHVGTSGPRMGHEVSASPCADRTSQVALSTGAQDDLKDFRFDAFWATKADLQRK
jgi:hypothetical protein